MFPSVLNDVTYSTVVNFMFIALAEVKCFDLFCPCLFIRTRKMNRKTRREGLAVRTQAGAPGSAAVCLLLVTHSWCRTCGFHYFPEMRYHFLIL